jgi:hypothetical protein
MKLTRLALIVVPLFASHLSAQCGGSDIASYWDYAIASDTGYSDFWSVVDGGGCNDPCFDGTVGYFVRSNIDDLFGNNYADGGLQSDNVPMSSPGSARSDATTYMNSLPVNTDLTYHGNGYAYSCSCNQCFKLATFSFDIKVRITQTTFGPLRASSGGFCSYSTTNCYAGTTPTCPAPHVSAYSVPVSVPPCPQTMLSEWAVVNGSCIISLDSAWSTSFNVAGPCN